MSDIWASVKGLLNLNFQKTHIDNNVFRLHYKVTTLILIIFGILITSRQYIGDPIDCYPSSPDIGLVRIIDQFCWIHSTYSVRVDLKDGEVGYLPAPYAGFAPGHKNQEQKFHYFYQWVWTFFFFQAVCFYLPHYLWKTWEGGRLKCLATDLNVHVIDKDKKDSSKKSILEYFTPNRGAHNIYAAKYFVTEVLNFMNLIFQVYLTNKFLGGEFSGYGPSVLSDDSKLPKDQKDPMAWVFPTVTHCSIHIGGPNGKFVEHQALCVLPLNILNQKLFLFLWFWFYFLIIVTGIELVYRVVIIFSPWVRNMMFRRKVRIEDRASADVVLQSCDVGDWFLLYGIGKNINPIYFGEILRELAGDFHVQRKSLMS